MTNIAKMGTKLFAQIIRLEILRFYKLGKLRFCKFFILKI